MSISIHIEGRKMKHCSTHLQSHIERDGNTSADEMTKIIEATESKIDVSLSENNVVFQKGDINKIREKFEKWQDAREQNGLKRKDKRVNGFAVGTLQLSDDALKKLGWSFDENDDKLPFSDQSERTVQNVTNSYKMAFISLKNQSSQYGHIDSAVLHFDEGSPHVDFNTWFLDERNPDVTVRDYLHGSSVDGKYKGRTGKLKSMQDNVMEGYRAVYESNSKNVLSFDDYKKKWGLERGVADRSQVEKNLRKRENDVAEREQHLLRRENDLNSFSLELEKGASELDLRVKRVNIRESDLNTRIEENERLSDALKSDVNAFDERVRFFDIHEQQFDEKQSRFNALLNSFGFKSKAVADGFMNYIKNGKTGLVLNKGTDKQRGVSITDLMNQAKHVNDMSVSDMSKSEHKANETLRNNVNDLEL